MKFHKIFDTKTGKMRVAMCETNDIEFVDPIEYFKNTFIVNKLVMAGVPFEEFEGKIEPTESSYDIYDKATILWNKLFQEMKNTPIPRNLIQLLETTKKSEQEQLLKGVELTPMILFSFIFEAFSNYGFRYSQYRTEILPTGINSEMMPRSANLLENGKVELWGTTELGDGQIKQAILHRTVTLGKFLEKGEIWHSFFTNYKSLNGEEVWLGENQPHFHYISNLFGLSRERVVTELKSKKYKLGNLPHIKLTYE